MNLEPGVHPRHPAELWIFKVARAVNLKLVFMD